MKREAAVPAQMAEWRERIGERLMQVTTCAHTPDAFGDGAVCAVCWANTQRIGRLIEAEVREWSAHALAAGASVATRPQRNGEGA